MDRLSNGRITPNCITLTGLLAHLPIAWLIAHHDFIWAAVLIIIFGLFDALDGALAHVQKKTSDTGMLLDSVSDRIKEVLIYIGIAYVLVAMGRPYYAVWAVAACGASVCVSYVRAKAEAPLAAKKHLKAQAANQLFRDGVASYDVRMTLLVAALLFNQAAAAVVFLTIISTYTALDRLIRITRKLG